MIGQAPDCEAFRQLFDWRDAVIPVGANGSDVAHIIEELNGQEERLCETSRRNGVEALLRHDWAYRWKEILAVAGLKPVPELEARIERLQQLAEIAGNIPSKRAVRCPA
jgi:hypothetical protein